MNRLMFFYTNNEHQQGRDNKNGKDSRKCQTTGNDTLP